ncbi:MAG: acyl-CoA reductase [Polyangiaceae bacterium]
MQPDVKARLTRLLDGARKLANREHPLGREVRARLLRSTGLSRESIEWALEHCLETRPSQDELEALANSVEPSPRAHVLLSANVFVAAHRALALALAASAHVYVRPSRREPEMTELLREAAPGLFQLVETLDARAGEQLFAYGHAETLSEVANTQPQGVIFHGHGPGFGLIVLNAPIDTRTAELIARDVAAFDQRGCLSPRLVLFEGPHSVALDCARLLAQALEHSERSLPRGELTRDELAEIARYRDTLSYSGDLFEAGLGYVGVAPADGAPTLAPVGRNLHILPVDDATPLLAAVTSAVTTLACSPSLRDRVSGALPDARPAQLGAMQTPRFDGPVDRRPNTRPRRL